MLIIGFVSDYFTYLDDIELKKKWNITFTKHIIWNIKLNMFLMCIKPIDQYTRTFTIGRLLVDGEK